MVFVMHPIGDRKTLQSSNQRAIIIKYSLMEITALYNWFEPTMFGWCLTKISSLAVIK